MKPTIRPATIYDLDGINRIAAESASLHARALPDRFREDPEPWPEDHLLSLIESDNSAVAVAERDGRIVGYVAMEMREATSFPVVRPRRFVLINEIAVTFTERRQGIGRLLSDAVVQWAREKDAASVDLSVYEFNEEAISFYEHLGFGSVMRIMSLPIDEPSRGDTGA